MQGSQAYDPWGTVTATTGTMTGMLGFQSAWTDPASGQDLMGARWYNPAAGDFTSADSIQVSPDPDPAAADPFGYAAGNPLSFTDPTGHLISAGSPATNPNWQADTAYANVFTQTYQQVGVTAAETNAAKAAAAVIAEKVAGEKLAQEQAAKATAAKKLAEKKAAAAAKQRAEERTLALASTLKPFDGPPASSAGGNSKKLTSNPCPSGAPDPFSCYHLNTQYNESFFSTGNTSEGDLLEGLCPTEEGFVTLSGCGTISAAASGKEDNSGDESSSPGASSDDPGDLLNLANLAEEITAEEEQAVEDPASIFGTRLDNISTHITERDLSAAGRELDGEIVARKTDGTPWDHVQEVQDAQNGLMNIISRARRMLGNPGLGAAERAAIEGDLSRASKMLDYTEKYVPRN